jgi:hypothetical protein
MPMGDRPDAGGDTSSQKSRAAFADEAAHFVGESPTATARVRSLRK